MDTEPVNPKNQTSPTETVAESDYIAELIGEWGIEPDEAVLPKPEQLERLHALANNNHQVDPAEDFSLLLDDVVTDFLHANSPEYAENIRIVHSNILAPEVRYAASTRQNILFGITKRAILQSAGISLERGISEDERYRDNIRQQLAVAQERDGNNFNPLRELGMLIQDQNGQDYFRFPRDTMPKGTVSKWQTYIDAVRAHVDAENKARDGRGGPAALHEADIHRKIAHDSLTRDLMGLLEVSDFDEMRKTVAKMRDSRFPNVDTDEAARLNRKIADGIGGAAAIRGRLLPKGVPLWD